MASLLRQIVAGPRLQHADTGLDLCYVTEDIIVTYASLSVPSLLTTHLISSYLPSSHYNGHGHGH